MKTNESAKTAKCRRCGTLIDLKPEYPPVCDECYTIYGSCCNDWENDDTSAGD